MLDMDFSRWLAASNIERRATTLRYGRVAYRLTDGSGHVGLDAEQWAALRAYFDAESAAAGRETRWLTIGLIPCIFLYNMTVANVLPGGGLVILGALLFGPVAIYLRQSNRMQRLVRAIEADLSTQPRITAPPRRSSRPPRWLETAAALLIGPYLILQLYGSLDPNAFRNTPWSGTHLDATGIVALLVLVGIGYFRWRARDRSKAEPPPRERAGRSADVIARAQRDGS